MAGSKLLKALQRPVRRRYEWLLVAFLLFLLISFTNLIYFVAPLAKAVFFLVAGWFWFLARVLPEMRWNWAAIGMFVACSALVIGGLQWLGRSLAEKGGWTWSRRWPWGIYLGCWILFLAAMGFTGAVHQAGWLWSSGEPWTINRYRHLHEFASARQAETAVKLAINDAGDSPEALRSIIAEDCRPFLDDCTVLLFSSDHGALRTILIAPRSADALSRRGFFRIEADGSSKHEPGDQLAPTIDRLNAGMFDPAPTP